MSPRGTTGTTTYLFTSAASLDYACLHYYAMLKNGDNDFSPYITSTTTSSDYNSLEKGDCIKTEISSLRFIVVTQSPGVNLTASINSGPSTQQQFVHSSTGLPRYTVTITESMKSALNSRPHAQYDFRCGSTDAVVGKTYKFGSSIGYNCGDSCLCIKNDYSSFVDADCSTLGDFSGTQITMSDTGWWPPGPGNPTDQSSFFTDVALTINPMPEIGATGCYMAMGVAGYFVNGVPLYSIVDGLSYKSLSVWHNNAPAFEVYDMDLCSGHAALGQYHHHTFSGCLADRVSDSGTGHSPVYGFAVDGFPIYGPWQASGLLATPCWKARDYDGAATKAGGWGCGEAGERSCVLNNPFNASGVTLLAVGYYGPPTSQTVYSQSGNSFAATSGVFFEDHYYDASCYVHQGTSSDPTLDAHNGHDHEGLGYHYHLTVTDASTMSPQFPYGPGPQFFGCVSSSYCKLSVDSGSGPGSSVCSGVETHNFGKKLYSSDHSCSVTGMWPSMAPSPKSKTSCSVESTESTDSCSTTATDWDLVLYLCIGIIIGVPLLGAVAFVVHTRRSRRLWPADDKSSAKLSPHSEPQPKSIAAMESPEEVTDL